MAENQWLTLGENRWITLAENGWFTLAENEWLSIVRKLTTNRLKALSFIVSVLPVTGRCTES